MKKLMILFLLLAACSSTNDKQVNTILSMARPRSIGILQGKSTEQIRQIMGKPTFVRKESPNESWVFKAPDCALFIFFDENGVSTFTESKGSCDAKVAKRLLEDRNKGV